MSTYTPGPWRAVPHLHNLFKDVQSEHGTICEVYNHAPGNADLIAAAPDLLAAVQALDKFQSYFQEHAQAGERMPGNEFYSDLGMEVVKLARAAIAKAVPQ